MVRLASGIVMAALLLALILYGSVFHFFIFCLVVATLGAHEFFSMLKAGRRPAPALAGVPAAAALAAALYSGASPWPMAAILGLFILGLAVSLTGPEGKRMETGANLVYGAMFTGAPMAALALVRAQDGGAAYVVMLITATALCDTGAYYTGRKWGKRKLAPALSPGKTVEGFIGGVAGAMAGAFIVWWLFNPPFGPMDAAVCGLIAGFLGPVGDLAESAIKRDTGVKDSGAIIPGHGGVLDRADSLLFTSAAFYLFLQLRAAL